MADLADGETTQMKGSGASPDAARQREFAEVFGRLGLAEVARIPVVASDRSARRVLTTEMADGLGFEAACAAPGSSRACGSRPRARWWRVFVSKDENLTKAHVGWLEARLVSDIVKAKRAEVSNGNSPGGNKLPEPVEERG